MHEFSHQNGDIFLLSDDLEPYSAHWTNGDLQLVSNQVDISMNEALLNTPSHKNILNPISWKHPLFQPHLHPHLIRTPSILNPSHENTLYSKPIS